MAIVSSLGELTAIASPGPSAWMGVTTSGPFYDGYRRTYGEIYKRQPAVRTVVDFFARNIAQLGLQVFERRSDTERVRLVDQPLPQLLQRPNPATSRYRFFESTVQDVGIYANGYWLKVRERERRITALGAVACARDARDRRPGAHEVSLGASRVGLSRGSSPQPTSSTFDSSIRKTRSPAFRRSRRCVGASRSRRRV
jgi:hypothetical protein